MFRMTFTSAVVLVALAASSSVDAQQVDPADALNQATQMLAAVPSAPLVGADQIAALRQDFTDFASAYLAGSRTPSTGAAGAVGTSGRTDAPADWRTRYQRVEADLAALLGPVGGSASAGLTCCASTDELAASAARTTAEVNVIRTTVCSFF